MTEQQWDRIIDLWADHPGWFALATVIPFIITGAFLVVLTIALVKAGDLAPPQVALIVILGLLAVTATLLLAVNEKSQAMSGLATTAIGALAGALGAEVAHGRKPKHGDKEDADA